MKLGGKPALVRSAAYVAVTLAVIAVVLVVRRQSAPPNTGDWRRDWAEATEKQRIALARRMVARGELIGHSVDECFRVLGRGSATWPTGQLMAGGVSMVLCLDITLVRVPGTEVSVERIPDWVLAWRSATSEERVQITNRMAEENPLEGHSWSECMEALGTPSDARWNLGFEEELLGSVNAVDLLIRFDDRGRVSSAQVNSQRYGPGPLRRALGLH